LRWASENTKGKQIPQAALQNPHVKCFRKSKTIIVLPSENKKLKHTNIPCQITEHNSLNYERKPDPHASKRYLLQSLSSPMEFNLNY
jgi:hypothetical protein